MKKIFYFFLSRPVTSSMLFFCVLVLGIVSFLNLPIELMPEIEYPRLTINTVWNGVPPEVVEANLTSPIESALSSIKGVKKISSRSSEGTSVINLEFHPDVDMNFIKLEINEKLNLLKNELPPNISYPRISSYIPEDFRELQGFLTYTVSANVSANEIHKYINDYLRTPLLSVSGVSNVRILGGNEREIKINVDFDKAKYFNIQNEEIIQAVENSEKFLSSGSVKKNDYRFSLKIDNRINLINQINQQIVKVLNDGTVIRIQDIAEVIDGYEETNSYYRINGKEAVFIEIDKEYGINIVNVADKVYEKIEELSKELPTGFQITKEIDKSDLIRNEINELYQNAGYSFLLLFLILTIIFRKVRYTFIIITSIIFSVLGAVILFFVFNIPLNILTLASITLGFGLMVDNSIVVIDYLDKKYDGRGIKFLSVHLKNIFFPVFASTLTTIAVFIPLLFLTGELRLYFGEFALATLFTLTNSLFVSFTIIPALFNRFPFIRNRIAKLQSKGNAQSYRESFVILAYKFISNKIFKYKKISLVILILMFGLPIWLLPGYIENSVISVPYNFIFGSEFYQQIKKHVNLYLGGALNLFFNEIQKGEYFSYGGETYLMVYLTLPNGNQLEKLNELTKSFEEEILRYQNNIKTVTANVMSPEDAYIRIDFTNEQGMTAFPYLLKNYLTAFAIKLGGLEVGIYGFGPGFYSGGGSFTSFVVQTNGYNYSNLEEIAKNFKNIIEKNPRIDNVDINRTFMYGSRDNLFEITAIIEKDNYLKYSYNKSLIFDDIIRNTEGNFQKNILRLGNEEIRYSIKFSNYKNLQLDELEDMVINVNDKDYAKMRDLINFEKRKILSNINRENQQYVRYISFDYKGPYQYGNEYIKKTIENFPLSPGYSLKIENNFFRFGEEEEIQIWNILLLAIIIIFMITAGLFESYKKPFLIILAIPFSFMGTMFLFYLLDLSLDRGAYAGLLLLVGLAVNNSIILVDYISKNVKTNNINEIISLSVERIRPIFTTSLTTVFALLPLLISSSNSFWKSLSFSVTGGILLSSILIMLYIPLFYWMMNRKKTITTIND